MHVSKLISIGVFTVAVVLTVYTWMDVIERQHLKRRAKQMDVTEGFDGSSSPSLSGIDFNEKTVKQILSSNEPVPTDADAVAAHQTLLRYIRNDFSKGIVFVTDLGKRFFGDGIPLRPDLDVRTLMDNYQSPL